MQNSYIALEGRIYLSENSYCYIFVLQEEIVSKF